MISYVNIEFASSKIKAADHFDDIFKAVEYARMNLKSRRNITLHNPIVSVERVWIPVTHSKPFKVGYSLKGISYYLIHKTDESFDYTKYFVGRRLLFYEYYTELPGERALTDSDISYREMTIQEIEHELGYRIKIVGEK